MNWVGVNAVTDIRQKVFDKLLRHDAQFFESHSTGRIMSSVMSDIDKIQIATSSMLADWLRQIFSASALLYVVLQRDWRLAIGSLTVLPIVLVPTIRIGTPHSPHHAARPGQRSGTERNPSGSDRRPTGSEGVWQREARIVAVPCCRLEASERQSPLCCAAGDRVSADRILWRLDDRRSA